MLIGYKRSVFLPLRGKYFTILVRVNTWKRSTCWGSHRTLQFFEIKKQKSPLWWGLATACVFMLRRSMQGLRPWVPTTATQTFYNTQNSHMRWAPSVVLNIGDACHSKPLYTQTAHLFHARQEFPPCTTVPKL